MAEQLDTPNADAAPRSSRRRRRPVVTPEPETAEGDAPAPEDAGEDPRPQPLQSQSSPSRAQRRGKLAARIPAPRGSGLLLQSEQQLLLSPLTVDRADVWLTGCEAPAPPRSQPLFLEDGAAPAYIQTADSLSFRKLSAAAAAEVNEAARRRIAAGDAPTASAQVTSAVIGATCYAAQGVLAGASLLQALALPVGSGSDELSPFLAYAPLAIKLQAALLWLALLAFLGAADAVCCAPAGTFSAAAGACGCFFAVVLLLALELPLDVALKIGHEERLPALRLLLESAGGDPRLFFFPRGNTTFPGAPVPMGFEAEGDDGPFLSMRLSKDALSVWQWLVVLRTIATLAGYALYCGHLSPASFALPPLLTRSTAGFGHSGGGR